MEWFVLLFLSLSFSLLLIIIISYSICLFICFLDLEISALLDDGENGDEIEIKKYNPREEQQNMNEKKNGQNHNNNNHDDNDKDYGDDEPETDHYESAFEFDDDEYYASRRCMSFIHKVGKFE